MTQDSTKRQALRALGGRALRGLGGCPVAQPAPQTPAAGPEVVPSQRGQGAEQPAPAEQPDEPPATEPPAGEPVQPGALAAGEACKAGAECASGVCEGEGCEVGVCAPAQRACTRDLRPYCGCDGQTFRTSGSCPGRLFAHRGECQ